MDISSVNSSNTLLKHLEASGLSASTASLIDKDLEAAAQAAQSGATATTTSASVRTALDDKIDADVSSGKISASDAASVKKTLDSIDAQAAGSGITGQGASPATATNDATASAGGGGVHGGGGGGAAKTEVSETVTIAGSTMTTTITYTDGTTATTTTTATAADVFKYGKTTADDPNPAAHAYLSTIDKGSLIDLSA